MAGCQATPATHDAAAPATETASQPLTSRAMAESFYEVLLAEIVGQDGDLISSYELLMRAAQTRQQAELYQRAGQAAMQARDGQRALRSAQAWLDLEPNSRDANKAVLQVLLALNQIPQTQWHLKQELRLTPPEEMAENLYAIPLLYQRASDKEVVLRVVQAALEPQLEANSPWRADALAAVGRVQLQADNAPTALQLFRDASAINSQSMGVAFLALELYSQGEVTAGPYLYAYAQSGEVSPQFLMGYSRLLVAQRKNDEALQVLTRLTQAQPEVPEAWLAKAALQAESQDYAGASASLDRLETVLEGFPDTVLKQRGFDESYLLRAQMDDLQGRHAQASAWLSEVSDADAVIRAQLRRAQVLAKAGYLKEARELIQQVPAVDEETQRLKVLSEVQLLRDNGLYGDAYALQNMLVQREPGNDDLLYEQALLAERLGKNDEMERMLRAIIARSPEHAHALNALGYSFADRGIRLREARRLIESALRLEPDSAFIADSLGWLEYRSGNLTLARDILQEAYAQVPDAEIAAHLGEVLWKLGEHDQARTIWQQGLQANASNDNLRETIQRLDPDRAANHSPAQPKASP